MSRRQQELARELAKPLSVGERIVALLVFFGPLFVGFGAPLVVAALVRPHSGWPVFLELAAMVFLVAAGYVLVFAAITRRSAAKAPSGLVSFEGRVAEGPDPLVKGPLTGRACVWAVCTLVRLGPAPRGQTITGGANARASARFRIVGASGETYVVDPGDDGVLRAGGHAVEERAFDGPYGPHLQTLVTTHSLELGEREEIVATEHALRVGDRAVVRAFVRRGAAYRDDPTPTLAGTEEIELVAVPGSLADLEKEKRGGGAAILGIALGAAAIACMVGVAIVR